MTQQRDIQSLLDLWLAEGSAVAPDRVIDVVADRIERQPQRGRWRFPTREFHMPALIRLAGVAAALAVLAAGAVYLAGSPRPSVAPSPGPSPTAAPSPRPSPSPYVLPPGLPYQSPGTVTSTGFEPRFQLEAPLGWTTIGSSGGLSLVLGLIHDEDFGDSGNVGGSVSIRPNPVLGNVNSCPDARTAPPALGPATPAAEIVASLLTDPRFAVVAGPAITIDGWVADVLDVQLAPGFTGSCMVDGPSAFLLDEPGSFVVLQRDERMRLIVLEVNDVPLVMLIWPDEEAYDAFVARAMGLIDGITFLP